jgi:HAD superfamily hydrolase (TIGR01509 family)
LFKNIVKKAFICDLDGSLVVSVGLHEKAWQRLFENYNIELTDAELKEQSGKKNILFIELILGRRERNDLDPQKLSDEKDDMVVAVLEQEPAVVYPHAKEMLELLQGNGITPVLATSATKRTALILGKEVMPYFRIAVFGEDVAHGKPDPEIFLTAAAQAGFPVSNCAVLEDAKSGVEAAKAGGFVCVARDNGLGQDLTGADLIVMDYNPATILSFLQEQ